MHDQDAQRITYRLEQIEAVLRTLNKTIREAAGLKEADDAKKSFGPKKPN